MQDSIIQLVIGASIPCVFWFIQYKFSEIQKSNEQLRSERRKLYIDVIEPHLRAFTGVKDQKEQQAAIARALSFEYKKIAVEFNLIGTDSAVKSFNSMMQLIYSFDGNTKSDDAKLMLVQYGELLLEFRKNLGNSDTKLTCIDMLEGQITDARKQLLDS